MESRALAPRPVPSQSLYVHSEKRQVWSGSGSGGQMARVSTSCAREPVRFLDALRLVQVGTVGCENQLPANQNRGFSFSTSRS